MGFLTRIDRLCLDDCLAQLLAGSYTLEHRLMLSVRYREDGAGESDLSNQHALGDTLALNDVVIKHANPAFWRPFGCRLMASWWPTTTLMA